MNYRNNYGRLPCPADITQAENSAAFGTEVYTTAAGDGTCNNAGGTTNRVNSGTDPDGPGGTDPGATDPLYDATTASQVVQGAIPTKTLNIDDKYAYDSWGNKIFYALDKRITATNAFSTYLVGNSVVGAVVIKSIPNVSGVASTGTLANALTYKGLYALISTGKNGHGGYVRNIANTSVVTSASSTNTDELDNCHCNSSATATAFNRIFVQKPKTQDVTSYTDNFDDIVRFKTRFDMANTSELQ
jgi:hypothetical protein